MTATRVSAVTAYTAHREWASRPPDERYASVHALYDAARARHARIKERTTESVNLRTEVVDDDDLAIRNTSARTAALTHWSFGQLATIASAPPSYLRTLPAPIASQLRERRKAPTASKSAAQRWAESRERVLLVNGKPDRAKEVQQTTTLREFAPRFIESHAKANQLKASGIAAKECVLRRGQSRNSPAIRISGRRSGTCTSARLRWMRPSGCWRRRSKAASKFVEK